VFERSKGTRKQGKNERKTHLLPDQDLILILITLSNLVLNSLGFIALDFLADLLEVYLSVFLLASITRRRMEEGKHTVKDLGTLSSFSSDRSELLSDICAGKRRKEHTIM
jgi:hypothetical protein